MKQCFFISYWTQFVQNTFSAENSCFDGRHAKDTRLKLLEGWYMDVAGRNDLKTACIWTCHTMDLLWEKSKWILPLYMKPISFQSKASVVCSVTGAIFIDFCLKKLNVFSQHIGQKNKWISELYRTNPHELKCWSTFCVNYFLRYYLMMQHQPIVKRFI